MSTPVEKVGRKQSGVALRFSAGWANKTSVSGRVKTQGTWNSRSLHKTLLARHDHRSLRNNLGLVLWRDRGNIVRGWRVDEEQVCHSAAAATPTDAHRGKEQVTDKGRGKKAYRRQTQTEQNTTRLSQQHRGTLCVTLRFINKYLFQ